MLFIKHGQPDWGSRFFFCTSLFPCRNLVRCQLSHLVPVFKKKRSFNFEGSQLARLPKHLWLKVYHMFRAFFLSVTAMSPRPKHVWLPGYMRADCVDLFLVSYLRPAIVCLTWLLAFSTSHYHSFKAYERLKRCTRLFGINTMLLCVERS